MSLRPSILASLVIASAPPVLAQQTVPGSADALRLGALQRQAVAADPRQRQFDLLAQQTQLRLNNLAVEWLPSFNFEGQAQYQSQVFTAPALGGGALFPSPSHDTYDGHIAFEQPLLDLTIGPRRGVERAERAESEAAVRVALHGLRQEVNEAFFNAALLAERSRITAATISDLESQLQEAQVRVREGAALPSDTAAVRATLLERRQDQAEVRASRRAALAQLAELIKRSVTDSADFVLPDLAEETTQARAMLADLRSRPEYEQLASTRYRLAREQAVVSAERRPRVSAFGRVGYGRPGLNPISNRFDSYFVAGVEVKWAPWNWGSSGRERGAIVLQQQIVATEEAALTSRLTRDIQGDLAEIDRLDSALALDDRIVVLRERVEDEVRIRFREGVVTASEYVDRSTDLLHARLARATHQVEQVQARARLLTSLGLEIR